MSQLFLLVSAYDSHTLSMFRHHVHSCVLFVENHSRIWRRSRRDISCFDVVVACACSQSCRMRSWLPAPIVVWNGPYIWSAYQQHMPLGNIPCAYPRRVSGLVAFKTVVLSNSARVGPRPGKSPRFDMLMSWKYSAYAKHMEKRVGE
jgi:hypothetical protein